MTLSLIHVDWSRLSGQERKREGKEKQSGFSFFKKFLHVGPPDGTDVGDVPRRPADPTRFDL